MASVRVRAFRDGFYKDRRYRAGAEFSVAADTVESGWFEPVDPSVKLKPRPELTPAQRDEREKQARARRKAAERKRLEAERLHKGKKDEPVALSQLHKRGEAKKGDEPLA